MKNKDQFKDIIIEKLVKFIDYLKKNSKNNVLNKRKFIKE